MATGDASKCLPLNSEATGDRHWVPDARDCLLDQMGKTETVIGALLAVTVTARWLQEHPFDDPVKRAAQIAINGGWRDYKNNLPLMRAWDQFQASCAHSVLCKNIQRRDGATHWRSDEDSNRDLLERAEWQLNSPSLIVKQESRRAEIAKQFSGT